LGSEPRKSCIYNKIRFWPEPNEPKIVPKSSLEDEKYEKKTLMT
jgi:hypothetical protein